MSNVSSITSAASSSPASSSDTVANPSQTLTQNDFLKLLVAQMQYQDPMNPQSDTQMAAQMAQFTALQQSTQMSSSLSMLQANNLVGSSVTVQVSPNSTQTATGVVTGVDMGTGTPQIVVTDATGTQTPYNLNQVLSMIPASPTSTTTPAANSTTGN
jgi:flagellar basal-body rod modification protein FlgD